MSIGSHSGVGPGGGGFCPVRRASWAVVVEECCLLAAVSSGGVVCARGYRCSEAKGAGEWP